MRALRRSLGTGLDSLDRTIARYSVGARTPDDVPRQVANGILAKPLRTEAERAFRRRELELVRRHRERLVRAYETLVRVYHGVPPYLGALFGAYETLGLGVRSGLQLGQRESTALDRRIDALFAELRQAGGLGQLLRDVVPSLELTRFETLRGFVREAMRAFAGMDLVIEPPTPFLADLHAAILQPELGDGNGVN